MSCRTVTMQKNIWRKILDLHYSERQLIVVQPDEVVDATRKACEKSSDPSWLQSAATISRNALRFTFVGQVEYAISSVVAWANARQSGVDVLQVARAEAAALTFPPGHPVDGTLYAAHPAIPQIYYTTASFHRVTFEHKFAEAVNLLMSLGATEIAVEHVHGWGREFAGRISVPLPTVETESNASQSSATTSSMLFKATLKNRVVPSIPADLVWYPHESTWQSFAKGRMEHGLDEFSLTVNYSDDYGVNADLKLKVQKAGLALGGTFEEYQATTWKLHAKFAERSFS